MKYNYIQLMNNLLGLIHLPLKEPIGSKSTGDGQGSTYRESQFISWEPTWIQNILGSVLRTPLQYCPYCGNYVQSNQPFLLCKGQQERLYECHKQCQDDSLVFTEFTKIANKTVPIDRHESNQPELGSQEFLVTITVEHPLTSYKYFSGTMKVIENRGKLSYTFDKNEENMFEPNMVLLPLKEFKITLNLKNLKNQYSDYIPLYFKVELGQEDSQTVSLMSQNSHITFSGDFDIISNCQHKNKIIDDLNYKYKHKNIRQNLIKFVGFTVQLPQNQFRLSSSLSSLYFLNPVYPEYSPVFSQGASKNDQFQPEYFPKNISSEQDNKQTFIQKLKTQNGSKQFQKNVKSYRSEEIEQIIQKILPYIEEIILDQYANYMFQSLLSICNFTQRYRLIQAIKDRVSFLVCQQQGTFVFQQLISMLTNSAEFQIIGEHLLIDFRLIVLDNYGNHFMRKFIQRMPHDMLNSFVYQGIFNIIQFGTNKNAVCVMKSLLKALKLAEKTQYYSETTNQILQVITQNVNNLINDEFGNYLIQQAFQIFGAIRLAHLSQYISYNFVAFSFQKYSSNVVINCFKKYWLQSPVFYPNNQLVSNKVIRDLYSYKESNKVLLEIMELPFNYELKGSILESLKNQPLPKFNTKQKWAQVLQKKLQTNSPKLNKNKRKYIK